MEPSRTASASRKLDVCFVSTEGNGEDQSVWDQGLTRVVGHLDLRHRLFDPHTGNMDRSDARDIGRMGNVRRQGTPMAERAAAARLGDLLSGRMGVVGWALDVSTAQSLRIGPTCMAAALQVARLPHLNPRRRGPPPNGPVLSCPARHRRHTGQSCQGNADADPGVTTEENGQSAAWRHPPASSDMPWSNPGMARGPGGEAMMNFDRRKGVPRCGEGGEGPRRR
jgi:hypothetical protein